MIMKKLTILLAAAALIAACTKATPEPVYEQDTTLYRTGTVTLLASIEDFSTKMEMPGTGHGVWKSGDEIAVFTSFGTPVTFKLAGTGDTKRAKFTGEIPSGQTLGSFAVYPASAVKGGNETTVNIGISGSYSYGANSFEGPMIAKIGDSWEITFSQLFSLVTFSFKQIPVNATEILIEEPGRSLAGNFFLNTETGMVTGIGAPAGAEPLKLSIPEGTTGVTVTLPLPVAEYKKLKASAFDAKGEELTSVSLLENNLSFDRAMVKSIETEFPKVKVKSEYIVLQGVSWCRGNLITDAAASEQGFRAGWRLADSQWFSWNYEKKVTSDGSKDYEYDPNSPFAQRYVIDPANCDHFNWGGIANWTSINIADVATPAGALDISGKMYTDAACKVATTDFDKAKYGDIAYWASNGTYRMPTSAEMATLLKCNAQFGHILDGATNMKMWGFLFTEPSGAPTVNTTDREISLDELEEGLFLPAAGRHPDSNQLVINFRTQGDYWTSQSVDKSAITGESWYSNAKADNYQYCDFLNFTSSISCGHSTGYAYDRRAGFCIRPVKK